MIFVIKLDFNFCEYLQFLLLFLVEVRKNVNFLDGKFVLPNEESEMDKDDFMIFWPNFSWGLKINRNF